MLQLIGRANSWAGGLGLQGSVHFMMANATVSLGSMLSSYPGPLTLVTMQVLTSLFHFSEFLYDL